MNAFRAPNALLISLQLYLWVRLVIWAKKVIKLLNYLIRLLINNYHCFIVLSTSNTYTYLDYRVKYDVRSKYDFIYRLKYYLKRFAFLSICFYLNFLHVRWVWKCILKVYFQVDSNSLNLRRLVNSCFASFCDCSFSAEQSGHRYEDRPDFFGLQKITEDYATERYFLLFRFWDDATKRYFLLFLVWDDPQQF
jgi:hypothetical protein